MMSLYTVIFSKAYFVCIKIFKEKEFPQYFAAGVFSMSIVITLSVIVDLILYQINPSFINVYFEYYKYFSIAFLLFCWWYFDNKKRYQKVLQRYENMNDKKKKVLTVVSVIYLLTVLITFFQMSNIMREYNLGS